MLNIANGKLYIGSAINLEKRQKEHFSRLHKNTHSNKHLQSAYNLYGKDCFVFSVLFSTTCIEALIDIEQLYIDSYDFEKDLYNITPTAGSQLGIKHSQETKDKLRQANLGIGRLHTEQSKEKLRKALRGNKNGLGSTQSEEHKQKISKLKSVKIYQIDRNTNEIIKCWDSMINAAKFFNVSPGNISTVCNGRRKTCGGFIWKYAN